MKKILFLAAAGLFLAAGCNSQTATNTGVQTPAAPTQTSGNSTAQQTPPNDGSTATAGDNSNAALNTSLKNIDGQMNSLNSDSANIDSSMNEQTAP